MRQTSFSAILIVTVLIALTANAYGDGFIHIVPPPGRHDTKPLRVLYHKVEVAIDNQLAQTRVDQEFHNPNNQVLEGTYMFPVPKGAAIDKFSMFIDGKETEAELLGADKARKIYEDIVRKLRDPALLEYAGRDLFKVRIYPLEPHGNKRVKLSYNQVVEFDTGVVRYVYPLNTEKFSSAPIKTVSFKAVIKSDTPIKSVYSPTHEVEVTRKSDHEIIVGFEASNTKPDRDLELIYTLDQQDVGLSLLTYQKRSEDGFFLALIAPDFAEKNEKPQPKDICFVLDTSGSMAANKKLDQAKKALDFCLSNLNSTDRFNLVRFSSEIETVFDELVPADTRHLDEAREFVEKLKPIGGTSLNDALVKAFSLRPEKGKERPYLIIFLTDGLPTIGETDIDRILKNVEKANAAGTRAFCFGVGYDVNTHLLDKVAEQTRAVTSYVKPEEDIEVKVSNFFTKIKDPVLSQVELAFRGVKVKDIYPKELGDIFRGGQILVVGRFEEPGEGRAILTGQLRGKKQTFEYPAQFKRQRKYEFLPRLWATQKVAYLLDEIRLHGKEKELVDEVTQLAKDYGIVTPYTSYLIVEDQSRVTDSSLQLVRPEAAAPAVQEQNRKLNYSYSRDQTGSAGVSASNQSQAMKQAPPVAAPAPMPGMMAGGSPYDQRSAGKPIDAGMGPSQPIYEAKADLAQQVKTQGPKIFYFNGTAWVDTEAAKLPDQKKSTVSYLSDEYFKLLQDKPALAEFFALGEKVLVSLDGVTYEVN